MDEHPLLTAQLVTGQHQRLRERPRLRHRHRDIAAGERELNHFPLNLEAAPAS